MLVASGGANRQIAAKPRQGDNRNRRQPDSPPVAWIVRARLCPGHVSPHDGRATPCKPKYTWSGLSTKMSNVRWLTRSRVVIEPEFSTEVLEVDGKGHIRIIPVQLLLVILLFVISPTTLRALYSMGVKAR